MMVAPDPPKSSDFRQVGDLLGELDLLSPAGISDPGDEASRAAGFRAGMKPGLRLERSLAALWGDLMGPGIAQNSAPVRLTNGKLVVTTSSPAWAQTLQLMGEDIRRRVNQALQREVVRSVMFRHAGWDRTGNGEGRPGLEVGASGEHAPAAAGWGGGGEPVEGAAAGRSPAGLEAHSLSEEEQLALEEVATLDLSPELKEKIAAAMWVSFVRGRQDSGR